MITRPFQLAHDPTDRPGRLRATPALRALRRETRLAPEQLIAPIFVAEDPADAGPISSMPGVSRVTLAALPDRARQLADAGVGAILLFGIPAQKDAAGSAAHDHDGVIPRAIGAVRTADTPLAIMTDVCLCQYTDHGHCGTLDRHGHLQLDESLDKLARTAVAHADAGADIVAPSAMLDGMVHAIRTGLDAHTHADTPICSYAVKYASAFYGPFREAADSAPAHGDRRAHQMDPANRREAHLEARLDADEGADILMVKPAGAYLDVISDIARNHPDRPTAAYQVSGEYAMLHAGAERGWLALDRAAHESLLAIRRAGADLIITYFAEQIAPTLR